MQKVENVIENPKMKRTEKEKVVEKYEKEFGEIKRPKPVEKAAKKATKARDKQNKQQKQKKSVKGSAKKSPSYLG